MFAENRNHVCCFEEKSWKIYGKSFLLSYVDVETELQHKVSGKRVFRAFHEMFKGNNSPHTVKCLKDR